MRMKMKWEALDEPHHGPKNDHRDGGGVVGGGAKHATTWARRVPRQRSYQFFRVIRTDLRAGSQTSSMASTMELRHKMELEWPDKVEEELVLSA